MTNDYYDAMEDFNLADLEDDDFLEFLHNKGV